MSDPVASKRLVGENVLVDPLVRELLEARLVAVFATFDPGGAIHAVPMWYAAQGSEVVLATSSRSRKVRNLEQNGRATLVVHDSRPGFEVCGASFEGTAEVVRTEDARPLVELVHARYVSAAGSANPLAAQFLASDDVALRFRPIAALTWDERDSAASRALRSSGGALPLVPTEPRD